MPVPAAPDAEDPAAPPCGPIVASQASETPPRRASASHARDAALVIVGLLMDPVDVRLNRGT
jgi:hypothetical protein